jgi:tetratricopeptide (TPR) repeat protein
VGLWRQIPRDHPRFEAAQLELAKAYENWLLELWSRSQPAEKVAEDTVRFLKEKTDAKPGADWNSDQVSHALRLCRILLHPSLARYGEAELLLEKILFGRTAGEAVRGEARRLIVTALLGQDKFDEARRMIETEFVGVPQELFAVVQVLEETVDTSSETRRRHLGKLQLAATERLLKDAEKLDGDQALQAEVYLALAYVHAGDAFRADEIFAKLRDRVPGNPRVLEAQAECFMQLGRYAQAREMWRQNLAMLREASPAWFRAKYKLALACALSGDSQQAIKIIQVTELLHPDLGGTELKSKMLELKAKCLANR